MIYSILMPTVTLMTVAAFVMKAEEIYSNNKDEWFFKWKMRKFDKDAKIMNEMYSLDELAEKFMLPENAQLFRPEKSIEDFNELYEKWKEGQEHIHQALKQRDGYREEARFYKKQHDKISKEVKEHRKWLEFSYQPTSHLLFKENGNGLINYDDFTFLVFSQERGGIVGHVCINDDGEITAVVYRRTIKSGPDEKVWEKKNIDQRAQHRIEDIKDFKTLKKHLKNFHCFQTQGLKLQGPNDINPFHTRTIEYPKITDIS